MISSFAAFFTLFAIFAVASVLLSQNVPKCPKMPRRSAVWQNEPKRGFATLAPRRVTGAASTGGDVTFLPRGTASPLTTITVSDTEQPDHDMVITVPITGLVRIRTGGG